MGRSDDLQRRYSPLGLTRMRNRSGDQKGRRRSSVIGLDGGQTAEVWGKDVEFSPGSHSLGRISAVSQRAYCAQLIL